MEQPKRILGTKINEQSYLEALARVKARENPNEKPETQTTIQNLQDAWKIEGVEYKNGIYNVNLSKQLLDNGNSKTQQQWADYRNQTNGFYTADMPLHHAIFKALYQQRDTNQAKEAREFLEQQFREKWLTTLTRITYTPRGKDKATHNFGTQEQYEIDENIIGEDGWIKNLKKPKFLEAILGSSDIKEINNIYTWITNKEAYIWRVNSAPEQNTERVARFYAVSGRADLDCDRGPSGSNDSLGVLACREATRS